MSRAESPRCKAVAFAVACAILLLSAADAFAPSFQKSTHRNVRVAGFLDDVGQFFDGLGSNNGNEPNQSGGNEGVAEEIDGVYTGSKRIITIPGELLQADRAL